MYRWLAYLEYHSGSLLIYIFKSRRTVLMLSYLLVPLMLIAMPLSLLDDYLSEMVLVFLIRDGLISLKEESGTQLYK